jgi:hypothetical protein
MYHLKTILRDCGRIKLSKFFPQFLLNFELSGRTDGHNSKETKRNIFLLEEILPYTRKNLTSCSKSANKPSTSCVRTACPKWPSCQQVWNKPLTTCNNLVDIIRLVANLFQQVRYSDDITILLQPCVVNLVAFLLYHDCIRLVRTTL